MSNFFNLDNPVWNFMGKLVDVFILTILWFVCSLPIFTIGPATTAVYYVTLKLVRDEESYTVRSFFKSFKQNFKQGVPLGLIELGLGVFFVWDIYLYYQLGSANRAMSILGILFLGIFIIYLLALVYVFALQAKFYNTVKQTLKNSLIISIRHVFRSLGMLAIAVGVIIGCLFFPPLFLLSTGEGGQLRRGECRHRGRGARAHRDDGGRNGYGCVPGGQPRYPQPYGGSPEGDCIRRIRQ